MASANLDHYLHLLYVLGAQDKADSVGFFAEKVTRGSMSMRAVRADASFLDFRCIPAQDAAMRKRVQFALAVLLVVVGGLIAWQALREREPVYQGKSLTFWLEGYISHGSVIDVRPEAEADEAVRQIGTNAIPTLLRMLRTHDSKLKLALFRLRLSGKPGFVRRIPVLPAYYPTREAATAFHALGANGSNAVPILIQTYRDRICLDSQRACVEALGWIGPSASEAIPDLLSAATNSDNRLRAVAVEALGHIHAKPELVLPVLTKSLQDSNIRVRLCAVSSLAGFGLEAKQAVPKLVELLSDANKYVRSDATNALLQVDPEAAAKAGVK